MRTAFELPRLPAGLLLILSFVFAAAPPTSAAALAPRTLTELLARSDRHPGLRAADEDVAAATGRQRQAAAWPNPGVDFERESLSGPRSSMEWTLGLEQAIEWPGVRSARSSAARELTAAASFRREAVRRDVDWSIARGFAEVALLEARTVVADSIGVTLDRASRIGRERHHAGDLADLDLIRLESERTRLEVERGRLAAELDAARRRLAGLVDWPVDSLAGGVDATPIVDRARSAPVSPGSPPTAAEAVALRHEAASAEARERVLARGLLPRPTVGFGYRRADDADGTPADGTVVTLGAELPLWNRSGGDREAARAEARRLRAEADLAERSLAIDRDAALRTAAALDAQLVRLDALVEERGPRLLEAAETGWREGEFSWLEWRDATRAWAELQELRFTLLHDRFVHLTRARQLAGEPLEASR
jgi:cobalt-zinc-cadmium efflux system outer membrane protein